MERFFQILAAILAGVAAWFWWRGNSDMMFVSVVGGCVSFFLSVRAAVRQRLDARAAADEEARLEAGEDADDATAPESEAESR